MKRTCCCCGLTVDIATRTGPRMAPSVGASERCQRCGAASWRETVTARTDPKTPADEDRVERDWPSRL